MLGFSSDCNDNFAQKLDHADFNSKISHIHPAVFSICLKIALDPITSEMESHLRGPDLQHNWLKTYK